MRQRTAFAAAGLALLALAGCQADRASAPDSPDAPAFARTNAGTGDPVMLAKMHEMNAALRARGLNIAVEQIEYFTLGLGRPGTRIHQQPFRWVPGDERREAQGDEITWMVATNRGATASGLSADDTKAAIQRAFATWNADPALKQVELVERPYAGGDVSIFDDLEHPDFDDDPATDGNPFAADIVNVGWLPRAFFEEVGGPGGGRGILAFSVTYIHTDDDDVPTDINGDNYLDTALNEVYYNTTFGQAGTDRENRPWQIQAGPLGIDVQTVALHENGHSLGLGHFGPAPIAVMNPVYAGIRWSPFASDDAGMNAIWASWPNP